MTGFPQPLRRQLYIDGCGLALANLPSTSVETQCCLHPPLAPWDLCFSTGLYERLFVVASCTHFVFFLSGLSEFYFFPSFLMPIILSYGSIPGPVSLRATLNWVVPSLIKTCPRYLYVFFSDFSFWSPFILPLGEPATFGELNFGETRFFRKGSSPAGHRWAPL